MTTTEELQNMEGQTAVDVNGAKLGKIGQIYVDDQTGQPLWVTITTGMFGTKQSFAPLYGSRSDGGALHLAVTKDMVTDAPGVEADGHIEDSENEALYTYYNGHLGETAQGQYQEHAGDTREDMAGRDGIQGRDTSGPTTDDAMTRSEERLRVGTETREAGRVHLRKYVVTEMETQTVPVRKETIRVEREPITEENIDRAMSGPQISEEEHEVVLHEERPVVATEAVPVERVRLVKETEVREETVSGQVRKERIETDDERP